MSATSTSHHAEPLAEPLGRLRRASVSPGQRWAAGICGVAILIAAGLLVGRSSLFAVDRIRVVGESQMRAREIVRLSGIDGDTNILFLDGRAAERRLEQQPWIADATVDRSYPSTVTIRIVERRPVAVLPRDGRYVLVADDGTELGTVIRDPGFPLVGAQVDAPTGGTAVPGAAAPAEALGPMPPQLRAHVREVRVLPDGALELRLTSGVRVLFGTSGRAAEKAWVLASVLRWARQERVELATIDVRAPSAPAAFLL